MLATSGNPAFIIRDLDKDPHGPSPPPKHQNTLTHGEEQLLSPEATPSNSPKPAFEACPRGMTRSASDLSTLTTDARGSTSAASNVSSSSTGAFPFTNIFKWKRTVSNASSRNSSGLHSPPIEEGSARISNYFGTETKPATRGSLDNLGISIQNSKSDFNSVMENQLNDERRLRHLAEDRLTEVEEEVTRLCTISLPTDTGETGDAYFSAIIGSVRLAIDSYEQRTDALEKSLEEKTARLTIERRERVAVDVECHELQSRLKHMEAQLRDALMPSDLQAKHDQLAKENEVLRKELEDYKSRAPNSPALTVPASDASMEDEFAGDDRATLLQRVKDTEAQRDALRQVSRGLRQRLTIETRKNADKMRALAAIDVNIAARHGRSHSRQDSLSCTSSPGNDCSNKRPARQGSLTNIVQTLQTPSRPKPERFVTALEPSTLQC